MFTKYRALLPENPGRAVARVALPVSLEFVLILSLQFINQVVVAGLGDTAVAAVGFANSINLIPLFVVGALGISSSILVARAYGAKREKELNKIVSVALFVGSAVAVVVALPVVVFPAEVLRASGASADVIAVGAPYLAVLFSGLIAGILSFIFSGILRSANHARSPMVATLATVVVNTPLAIILVYGWGPIPALGIVGAAWATLATTVIKVIILCVQTFGIFHIARWELPRRWREWRKLLAAHLTLAAPMGLTELFWTAGVFLYNVVTEQIGDTALASIQIVQTMAAIFVVGSLGLASAITALVGRSVGAGNAVEAQAWGGYIKRVGIITGVIFAIFFAASALALSFLYPHLAPVVISSAALGIWINALLQPFIVRMLLDAALLPSANDVRGILMGDFIGPFILGLPVAIMLAMFTPLGVVSVFIGRACDDLAKMVVFGWRARRLKWGSVVAKHNMVNAFAEDPTVVLMQAQ